MYLILFSSSSPYAPFPHSFIHFLSVFTSFLTFLPNISIIPLIFFSLSLIYISYLSSLMYFPFLPHTFLSLITFPYLPNPSLLYFPPCVHHSSFLSLSFPVSSLPHTPAPPSPVTSFKRADCLRFLANSPALGNNL